jgi:hypothetical protein
VQRVLADGSFEALEFPTRIRHPRAREHRIRFRPKTRLP